MLRQKTTWAGIASLVSSIGYAVATKDIAGAITGVISGFGLIFASDAVKSPK